ncbi:MAG: DUF1223 domain-containing protein [Pseudomonadota bacterium]
MAFSTVSRVRLAPALFASAAIISFAHGLMRADGESAAAAAATKPPVLVELFTSQSCSSCPPAERYLSTLAMDEDLVVVEWHVDYWDDLVYGGAGAWKDPYSKRAHTERQRDYNLQIRDQGGVYTPQTVIAGSLETIGSRRRDVQAAIADAPAAAATLSVDHMADGRFVTVEPVENAKHDDAEVIFVRLLKQADTHVKRGENHGKALHNTHVALQTKRLGDWSGRTAVFDLPDLGEGETCAIIVQEKDKHLGRALGAAYCA